MDSFIDNVILGDAFTILKKMPSGIADLGITSPPYNKGENKKGWLVENVKYNSSTDKLPEHSYQDNQVQVLNELYRIIKPGGSFFYNHKIRWESGALLHPMDWLRKTKWSIKQEIVWDRLIAANIRGWRFWQVEERIYWLYKPVDNHLIGPELKAKHALLTSIWRFPPEQKNGHPAPFPLVLPVRIIYSIMDETKGLILDPYCGSGTSLVAAKLLEHNYIGIDISAEYVNAAQQRLAHCMNENTTAKLEIMKHTVNKTFSARKQGGAYTGRFKRKATTLPLEI